MDLALTPQRKRGAGRSYLKPHAAGAEQCPRVGEPCSGVRRMQPGWPREQAVHAAWEKSLAGAGEDDTLSL